MGLSGHDFEVVHAEMVLSIGSMLHNGGFKKSNWEVKKCSAFLAVAERADSPMYVSVQGMLLAPAQA